jgi:hypothetical protein
MKMELMDDWPECVCQHWTAALSKPWSMLAMDAFCGHLSDRIRNTLRNRNTTLVTIPGGKTTQLQPHYVSIGKSFKHLVHKHYDAWLNTDNHILTKTGNIKRVSAPILVEWILKASKEVPVIINPK